MAFLLRACSFLCLLSALSAQEFRASREEVPRVPREFRGAWVAVVYNIDWPSRKGLQPAQQKAEMRAILDRVRDLRMNAVMLQVRPHCDALYVSRHEPWTPWLTGTMGRPPGYDPLQEWLREAHSRGIEVHAWFNPFRALANVEHGASRDHVTKRSPQIIKRYGKKVWCDPAQPETRQRAMTAIMDVVTRYDIDGVHLDDYFYPYPVKGAGSFPDGKSPAQRRHCVDGFVQQLYQSVKARKPWVRVGISPFGIWRPGVPSGIEAGVDSYEHLAADARKWLREGWVDYLMPQLYWRDQPQKQSFSLLLSWWRQQGTRPVWPGMASSRIKSSEDPGRSATEILNQIGITRKIGRDWAGHCHWSMKALMQDRDGINRQLKQRAYLEPTLVPPIPGTRREGPAPPVLRARCEGETTTASWRSVPGASRWAVQARFGRQWRTIAVLPHKTTTARIGTLAGRASDAVAVTAADRYGNTGRPAVVAR